MRGSAGLVRKYGIIALSYSAVAQLSGATFKNLT